MCDTFGLILLGINHEQRQDSFRSGHGICALEKLQSHRRTPQRGLWCSHFVLRRRLSCDGLCSTYLARVFAGHRGLSHGESRETVSHGDQEYSLSLDLVGCFELARLENLSRTCDEIDPQSKRALIRRETFARLGRDDLRARLDNDRSLLEPVRLGPISNNESGSKAAHAFGFARQYSCVYPYQRREDGRRERAGHLANRGRRFLHHGPRLCGLHPAFQDSSAWRFLCHRNKTRHECSPRFLCASRPFDWHHLRSDGCTRRTLHQTKLPRILAKNKIQSPRYCKDLGIHEEQYHASTSDHCSTLQGQVARRIVHQVDKTAFKNRTFNGHKRESRADSNLISGLNIRSYCLR